MNLASLPMEILVPGLLVAGAGLGQIIVSKLPIFNSKNGHSKSGVVSTEVCNLKHEGIDKRFDSGKQVMTDLCTDIKGLRQDFQDMKLEISSFMAAHEAVKKETEKKSGVTTISC